MTFYFWPLVTNIFNLFKSKNKQAALKEFGTTVGISIGSVVVTVVVIGVSITMLRGVLDRLLLANKVENTVPQLSGYTQQQIIITDHPKPLLDCYLQEYPGDSTVRIVNQIAGTSFLAELGYNSYYLNNTCLVVYLGAPLTLNSEEVTTSAALLAEFLIRLEYGPWIRVNADKQPAYTINVKRKNIYK